MKTWYRYALAAAVLVPLAFAALHSSGSRTPSGFHSATDDAGVTTFTTERAGDSATAMLRRGFEEISGSFDAPVEIAGGFRDAGDRIAEAFFRSRRGGELVAGLAVATTDGREGILRYTFGEPRAFARAVAREFGSGAADDGATRGTATRAASATGWHAEGYPDGSGRIELPSGWSITFAQRGHVLANGPHGLVEKGLEVQAYTRAAVMNLQAMGVQAQGNVAAVDPTDPANAMAAMVVELERITRAGQWRIVAVHEVVPYPVDYPLAQGAFIDNEQVVDGVRLRCLSNVLLSVVLDSGLWSYAQSRACAPPETFAANLPVLMRIWMSAETSPAEMQRRWNSALGNMREVGAILAGGEAEAARGAERTFAPTIEALQGIRVVEELGTGQRFDANLASVTELVNALNAQPGSPGYVEIPRVELVR